MKMIVAVALALVATAAALPVQDEPEPFSSEFHIDPEGGYVYGIETQKGIKQQAEGKLKSVVDEDGKPVDVLVTRGQFSYPDENGKIISITYEADENGYRAEGDSIPSVPSRR